jgi:precorrin-3B synthase
MNGPLRRGVCPGLSAPMQTGDGLLVRFRPAGAVPLRTFDGLCTLAAAHGNGIVEITARGSIQVRGLSFASAPRFAAEVAALGITAEDGVPILIDPLAGLAEEIVDLTATAADLRGAFADRALPERLSPKISVVLDGGGAIGLDALTADVRLRAANCQDDAVLQIGLGGDAASAAPLGYVALRHGAEAAMRLLDVLAERGRNSRARDVVMADGTAPFRSAVADLLLANITPQIEARRAEVLGLHPLRDRSWAHGFGLAFGHADASSLRGLVEVAGRAEVSTLVPAPGRNLIAAGLSLHAASEFAAQAERLGFIVGADDPRRRVIACAGAPFCASGHIAARALAPRIAEAITPLQPATIHLSGCAKGCAHPKKAALTIVGSPAGCELIAGGTARDTPVAVVTLEQLPATIANYARAEECEAHHV